MQFFVIDMSFELQSNSGFCPKKSKSRRLNKIKEISRIEIKFDDFQISMLVHHCTRSF